MAVTIHWIWPLQSSITTISTAKFKFNLSSSNFNLVFQSTCHLHVMDSSTQRQLLHKQSQLVWAVIFGWETTNLNINREMAILNHQSAVPHNSCKALSYFTNIYPATEHRCLLINFRKIISVQFILILLPLPLLILMLCHHVKIIKVTCCIFFTVTQPIATKY